MVVADQTENKALVWFLRTTSLFQDQTESILNWAGTQAREQMFQRGEVLRIIDGTTRYIYVVVEGKVKLRSVTESGKEKILDIAGPGDAFGPLDHVLDSASGELPDGLATEAVSLSAGLALRYEVSEFQRLAEKRPAVVINVSRLLGLKQRQITIRLSRLLFRSSLGKVAGLLAELGERYGEPAADGIELNLRLTHQEMASMIGVKRETVSECMAALELDELLSTRNRRFVILKPDELERIV